MQAVSGGILKELQDILDLAEGATGPLALATLLRVEGSSYRKPGARLLTDGEAILRGSLSGGCLEGEILARAREALADGAPRLLRYDLRGDADLVWGTGMGCEGVLEVLVERLEPAAPWMTWVREAWSARRPLTLATSLERLGTRRHLEGEAEAHEVVEVLLPPPVLWILGAELDQRHLVTLAKTLGWAVGVVDHRPALVTAARFVAADALKVGRPAAVIPTLRWDARSAVVLATHNYAIDREALEALAETSAGYIGLMGSRARCVRLRSELQGQGIRFDARLHAPVGLDLGAQAPESIALAILAEIQLRLEGGTGRPLSAC